MSRAAREHAWCPGIQSYILAPGQMALAAGDRQPGSVGGRRVPVAKRVGVHAAVGVILRESGGIPGRQVEQCVAR